MKKLFFILSTLFILIGCSNSNIPEEIEHKERFKDFDVVIIDSCEYLIRVVNPDFNRAYGLMLYKGNCIFCKEHNK